MILLRCGSFWMKSAFLDTKKCFKDAVVWPVFSISSSISPRYQLREKPIAFPATAKIMIGHRLGHLNFTLYRKQRGPPNHGVKVNDARFRAPFRRTRKLNDNDILHRRRAKYLRPPVENIYFFLSLRPFSSFFLFLFSTWTPPSLPPLFSILSSLFVLRSFP